MTALFVHSGLRAAARSVLDVNASRAPRALLSIVIASAVAACGAVSSDDPDAVTGAVRPQVLSSTGRMTGGGYVMNVRIGGSTQRTRVEKK